MITIFNDNRDDKMIISVIKLCETAEELDSVFGLFGVNEYSKKVNILNRIIGTGDIHFIGINNYPDVKQKYELCVQTFIDGSWKTAKQIKIDHENRRNMNITSAGLDLQYVLQPHIDAIAKFSKDKAEEFKQQIAAMNRQVHEDGGAFMPKKNDSFYYGMSKENMDYLHPP